jgi:hypothetical protein
LSVPERLPSCRISSSCCHREGIEISIVDSTPQSKLSNRFTKSSLHAIVSTMHAGSFEARACPKRPIPRGLHPALLEPCYGITIAIRATDICYRTVTDEYPRCVRLPAAFDELALVLHRPLLRMAFADESRVSRRPTRFDVFLRSPWALSSPRGMYEKKAVSDASVASPCVLVIPEHLPETSLLARPRSRRARPLVKGGKACVIRSAFPRSSRRSVHLSVLSEGRAISQVLPPGFAFRSVDSRATAWVAR